MKIPLSVYQYAGSLRIMAHFLLKVEGSKEELSLPIRAIVDTGSPTTLIGPLDLKRMRISKLKIERLDGYHRKDPINIGGGSIHTKIVDNAKIKFDENLIFEIPVNIPLDSEGGNQPSLLGVDFMLKIKAKLFFNPTNKEAYFEIEN
jgi:hypothetical protein